MGEGWSIFRTNMTITLGHLLFVYDKLEKQLPDRVVPYVMSFRYCHKDNIIGDRQRTYNIGGEGRSGHMGSIQAYDLRGVDVWGVSHEWDKATKFKAGDIHEEKSGSGKKLGGLHRAYGAIESNVLLRCMTSDVSSPLAQMVIAQKDGFHIHDQIEKLDGVLVRDDEFKNFDKTPKQKQEFELLYPDVKDTRELIIEVPGREETLASYEERSGLGLAGNLVEGSFLFTSDIAIPAYHVWVKKKDDPLSGEHLESLILKLMNDNMGYLRNAAGEISDQRSKIEPLLEEPLGKKLLLVAGTGSRSGNVCKSFEMRCGHAGFNDPNREIYYINMENWPTIELKINELANEYGREKVSEKVGAIVISESFGRYQKSPINAKSLTELLMSYGISPFVITANKEDELLRKMEERCIFISNPGVYSLHHGHKISTFPQSALHVVDSISSAWIKSTGRQISEEHKID